MERKEIQTHIKYNFCNLFEINLTLKWCKKDSLINGKNLITVPYQGTYSFFYFPIKNRDFKNQLLLLHDENWPGRSDQS